MPVDTAPIPYAWDADPDPVDLDAVCREYGRGETPEQVAARRRLAITRGILRRWAGPPMPLGKEGN
jgi:hypothetical protein